MPRGGAASKHILVWPILRGTKRATQAAHIANRLLKPREWQ
jgi:hypothetical protein